MKVNRRDCLRLGALAGAACGGAALLSGCHALRRYTGPELPSSVALPTGDAGTRHAVSLLNRAAFGPTPGEVEKVAALGAERWVDEQLNPDDDEDTFLTLRLRGLEVFQVHAGERGDLADHEILRQLQQAALLRAIYSRHQLRERMVEFWSNHFNIYARKGFGLYFKPTDEQDVIRKHALGRFPDLVRASAHSPAMLAYLDNQVNSKRDPTTGAGANENYARELMELHTLGVHGGYTQKDVQEVARCLTGWTIENRFLRARGAFRFDPDLHDDGPKTVLGVPIPPGGGKKDGDRVLEIVSKHPSTARFISSRICRYFLGEAADTWTEKLADIYRKTDGDIKAMLRPLLLSDELRSGPPILKRPFDFVVSALRATAADTNASTPLQEHLARMGQPLYQWPMPDGYPDKTSAWLGSVLARWNFAFALLSGSIAGTRVDLPALVRAVQTDTRHPTPDTRAKADALIGLILSQPADSKAVRPLREKIHAHLVSAPRSDRNVEPLLNETAALLIASPPFQWR